MRRSLGVAAIAVACAGFVSTPVGAQDHAGLDIPIDTVVRGEEGSEHLLATVPVPAEDAGRECDVVAGGANNESVHPGNDLVVKSGESTVELLDVEREAGAVTEASGTLTLGDEVTVTLVMGEDEVFSGGMTLSIDCPTPVPPTEPPTTTSSTVPPTTPPPADTPPAPPAVPVPGVPTFVG